MSVCKRPDKTGRCKYGIVNQEFKGSLPKISLEFYIMYLHIFSFQLNFPLESQMILSINVPCKFTIAPLKDNINVTQAFIITFKKSNQ